MNCCQRAFLCVRAVKLKSRAHVIELFQVNDAEQVFPHARSMSGCVCVFYAMKPVYLIKTTHKAEGGFGFWPVKAITILVGATKSGDV